MTPPSVLSTALPYKNILIMAYKSDRRSDKNDVLEKENDNELPLLRANFRLMAAAGVMIVLGFLLMAGGATDWASLIPIYFLPAA